MAPVQKLNDGMEGLRNERQTDLRKVRRRDYQDSGGAQRQFQELVEEFNTEEEGRRETREKAKDRDKVEIERSKGKEKDNRQELETLNRKASYRIKNSLDDDDQVGGKLDIEA